RPVALSPARKPCTLPYLNKIIVHRSLILPISHCLSLSLTFVSAQLPNCRKKTLHLSMVLFLIDLARTNLKNLLICRKKTLHLLFIDRA
ncbi:MAG: hypothetical protein ACRBF0_23755, partial [Calditrichia bacterium]